MCMPECVCVWQKVTERAHVNAQNTHRGRHFQPLECCLPDRQQLLTHSDTLTHTYIYPNTHLHTHTHTLVKLTCRLFTWPDSQVVCRLSFSFACAYALSEIFFILSHTPAQHVMCFVKQKIYFKQRK